MVFLYSTLGQHYWDFRVTLTKYTKTALITGIAMRVLIKIYRTVQETELWPTMSI